MNESIVVQVSGALSGAVHLNTESRDSPEGDLWKYLTVGDLRREILRITGYATPGCKSCTLLVAGRRLLDDSLSLFESGIGTKTKVLVLAGNGGAVKSGSCRTTALDRVRKAAEAMASREIASPSTWALCLETQDGHAVKFGQPEDRQAVAAGLALHEQGQATMRKGDFAQASQELLLAEEALGLCDMEGLGMRVDNKALLIIDLLWCWFKLQERSMLGVAQKRLQEARAILGRSHGERLERLRVLHGDFCPELATYVRLELLEGLSKFYQGDGKGARASLESARDKWHRLAVPDEALERLTSMGFDASEASRALRFCSGDTGAAIECVMKQREARREAQEREGKRRRLEQQQRTYGRTASGKRVDMDALEFLVGCGHERLLAAEALRQADNNQWAAVDILSNEFALNQLQLDLAKQRSGSGSPTAKKKHKVSDLDVARLVSLGYPEQQARRALSHSRGNVEAAVDALLQGKACREPGSEESEDCLSAATGAEASVDENADLSKLEPLEFERDVETEDLLASQIRSDPMDAYDVDVSEEGRVIKEFLEKIALEEAKQSG